ncbi:hypothetical protein K503DRAFT_403176 [Rhizopogon vinicolor AM-OR11-026]|uniref:Uncharacterized protein n=1 Tax=Rhizopogon vinicolor AM-OR11-026 TaxID=1314800 RepID=A0A1B7MQZ3_9AGAM|nr:hypothetical protein K503DRAFT_403176 [Rhizopogon vinicolor AM-OR11-026]
MPSAKYIRSNEHSIAFNISIQSSFVDHTHTHIHILIPDYLPWVQYSLLSALGLMLSYLPSRGS